MAHRYRRLILATLCLASLLAACEKSEPPPPLPAPKVEAPPPAVNPDLKRLAGEVFVFAYPLVLMGLTQEVSAAQGGINSFTHVRTFPDAATVGTVNPNADVLYSTAWLDLAKGPVVLSVPDTRGRYYVIAMLDAWSNVFSSVGKRTIGTGKIEYAIVGPTSKGALPKDSSEIRSPTDLAWIVGRFDADGKADAAAVAKLQDQLKLMPLSSRGKASAPPAAGIDLKTPPAAQVAAMDAHTFFTRFALLLPNNPPAKDDAPMVAKIAKLGVVGGQPFAMDKLDAISVQSIEEGVTTAKAALVTASKGSLGELKNGWTVQWDLGRYGTNYGYRAVMALLNLGANAPEDAIFAATHLDAAGRPLNGANAYVLHFDKNNTPPTQAFWALSMYGDERTFVANAGGRYTIGSRDKLLTNPDGSIDIYLGHASPGRDKESNWLPAPEGNFNVILRNYWPKQEALDQKWMPPAIKPLQ